MKKKYYEVVFEGHYNAIKGLLQGFKLGKNLKWNYYFSKKLGIQTETLAEKISDWATLSNKIHHVIMDADFFDQFKKAIATYNKTQSKESKFVSTKYIKSTKTIKKASFEFKAKTFGKPYGEEIKDIIKKLSKNLKLANYKPVEKVNKDAKGVELYAPVHDYSFEASGTIAGDLMEVIDMHKKMDYHPLIEVSKIKLSL